MICEKATGGPFAIGADGGRQAAVTLDDSVGNCPHLLHCTDTHRHAHALVLVSGHLRRGRQCTGNSPAIFVTWRRATRESADLVPEVALVVEAGLFVAVKIAPRDDADDPATVDNGE